MAKPRSSVAAGFTLVEMVIAVLVLAIAAGLAAPLFRGNETTKLREAARLLTADLAYAQVESIAHADNPRLVQFDKADGRWSIRPSKAPNDFITDPITKGPYQTTFGQGRADALAGVAFDALKVDGDAAATKNRLGFGIYGQLDQTTNAAITLACQGRTLTLTVDAISGDVTLGDIK